MKRDEEYQKAAFEYIESDAVRPENMQLAYGDFINGAKWADAHPDWHTMDELPEKDPTMVSRGFNMSLPVLLCDVENLTAYAGARYHYDPARYNFDKKQWEDIIGYCDEEIGITHTHWMYQPEPPEQDPTEQTINQTF